MRIAIVGNGRSLVTSEFGQEIDSHDLVIRMNLFYKLLDKKITGVKTDVWACCFNWVDMYIDEPNVDIREVWVTRPVYWDNKPNARGVWKIPEWVHPRVTQSLTDQEHGQHQRILTAMGGSNPTTGLNTVLMANKLFPNIVKDLYGYDFYEPAKYYYDEADIEFPIFHHHKPSIEKKIILQMQEEGKVCWKR